MKPFKPCNLPIKDIDIEKLIFSVSEASKKLSLYNGILQVMPNPNILLAPMSTREAVLSSKIEGTQVSFTDILEHEAGEEEYNRYKTEDINEVINYRTAMFEAEKMFKERPFIHLNMIKNLHSILLSGVRGNNKARGEFRREQVHIGSAGCKIEEATFVPPEWFNVIPALDNWEKYINGNSQETLIQCAVMHAQFEIIHPFLDGNGRLGRMIIPLFLYQKDYINKPVFYLSEYFESNKDEYYNRLNLISENNDWNGWIEFFLGAIIAQSNKNIEKSKEIIDLYNEMKRRFIEATHSEYAINVLDGIFQKPIITSTELAKKSKINSAKTYTAIFKKLVDNQLLDIKKGGSGNRPTIYYFKKLINIAED